MSLVVSSKPHLTTFRHFDGNCYVLELPELVQYADSPFVARSDLVVREDDRLIGKRAFSVDEVVRKGRGAYLHFGDALFFSTSDNTDPNRTGRVYEPYVRGYSKGAFSAAPKALADVPYSDTDSHSCIDMRATPKLRAFYEEFQKRNTCRFKGLKDSEGLAALFYRIGQSGSSAATSSVGRTMPMYSFGGWQNAGKALSDFFGQERSQRLTNYKLYDTHNYVPLHPIMDGFARYFTMIRDPRRAFLSHYFWNTTIHNGKYSSTGEHYTFDEWLDIYYESHKGRHRAATLPMTRWFTHLDQPMFTIFEQLVTGTFQSADFDAPFEKAMKNSHELFFFIGITEYFDESLFILYLLLDIPKMPLWGYDLRSVKPSASEISPEQQAKIDELVATDVRFYTYWREKFETDFAAEIEFFRENVKSLRGQIVPQNPMPSRGLADGFFAKLAASRPSPEIYGPREAASRAYEQFDRRQYSASQSGRWAAVRTVLTYGEDILGPDGRKGSYSLVEDTTAANTHDMRMTAEMAFAGRQRVAFAYVKAAGRSHCTLWLYNDNATQRASASFSLETGDVTAIGVIGSEWSEAKAGMMPLRDGWCWIWLTAETADAALSSATLMLANGANESVYYDGDGKSGVHVFDPRIEPALAEWGW